MITTTQRWLFGYLVTAGCLVAIQQSQAAEKLDYATADPALKVVLIDKSDRESFLAVRCDTLGRLFVGGREALFVYEPEAEGGYKPREELLRFPDHTWVYDIAIRGNDLYVLTTTALYLLPDAVVKRTGIVPKRLLWGVPLGHVHQCFHGLAWGPEGDLYISMGDPIWYYGDFNRPDHWGHWTFFSQPEGTKTHYTGVGAVFRVRPDGSRMQIVARGLRNSCGLVFDNQWNLFTNDNDHEGIPSLYVPGRLLHIVPNAYYSWPRGWLRSKNPERSDLLDTLNEKLGRFVPVGQSYYDDLHLPAEYRNNLLVARWCTRQVTRYQLQPSGASFKCEEYPLLVGQNEARPVGVTVGRGGRLFATISYMAQNEGSPVYRSDVAMITRSDDPPAAPFDPYDAVKATTDKLWSELSNPAFSRREAALVEIWRRGGKFVSDAPKRLATIKTTDPAAIPLVWLASSTLRKATPISDAVQRFDTFVRSHAWLAMAEYATWQKSPMTFPPQMETQRAMLQWLRKGGANGVVELLTDEHSPLESSDPLLRHLATMLVAEKGAVAQISELCRDSKPTRRLAGVLACGFRLTLPPADRPIADDLPLDPLRDSAAYAIEYVDAKIDLRSLGRIGNFTIAEHWKARKHTDDETRLFDLLSEGLDDSDDRIRLQAAHFLTLLNDPRTEPRIEKVIAANDERRLSTQPLANVVEAWLCGPFAEGVQGFKQLHGPEKSVVDLSEVYRSGSNNITWRAVKTKRKFEFVPLFGPMDDCSVYAFFRIESGAKQRSHLLLGSDDGVKLWHNGQLVWTNDVARAALPYHDQVAVELQPGSNDFLVRVRNFKGDSGLYVSYRTLQGVNCVMPERIATASLAERLASTDAGYQVPKEFLTIDWPEAIKKGNPDQGRKLFDSIGCAKCHAVQVESAVIGGPSLADAAKRFTIPHLVESVLLPSKQLSSVFKSTRIVTADGKQFTGLIVGETGEKLELLQPDTKRITLEKNLVEVRALQDLSPMPQGVIKKTDELRDLLAYLLKN